MSNLERYGLEWKSAQDFVCHPMDDGYWTPWHIAHEQITTLRQQLAKSEARVAELESYNEALRQQLHQLMTSELKTAVDYAQSFILRKQAEAVEASVSELMPGRCGAPDDPSPEFNAACEMCADFSDYAQRLRQKADDAERAGGEHG